MSCVRRSFHWHLILVLVISAEYIACRQDNPQTVESVLGVLNLELLAKCKQLKLDATATENSTQNSNTYQKDVTKKGGAESIKTERRKENRHRRLSKTKASSCSNFKEGSTQQTERFNSRDGRTDTICDKQSLSNTEVAEVVDENDTIKYKSRSGSAIDVGAFLTSPLVVAATAAKKPTPAPAAFQIGIPPLSLGVSSLVQLDEVMLPPPPPPPQSPTTTSKGMTSQRGIEYSTSLPVPTVDNFNKDFQRIGDGEYPKGYQKETASQWKVKDGAANASKGTQDNQEAWQRAPATLPTKNDAAMSGQMEHLNYSSNAMYTFVKYGGDEVSLADVQCDAERADNIPEEECFNESCTRLTTYSAKNLQTESFKSLIDSNQNLISVQPQQPDKETKSNSLVRALLEERNDFVEQCKDDPLYTNPQFPQPWKVLSKISQSIASEVVENFENELSFGEESYVRDFIDMEMQM